MKFLCRLYGHQRSASRARFDYKLQRWRSVCRHCGVELLKDPTHGWRSVADAGDGEQARA